MDIKKYLETCSREELAEVLLTIPGVTDYLVAKRIKVESLDLAMKIPNHLISGFYLEIEPNGHFTIELRRYILNHFSGADAHILLTRFNLTKL